MRFIDFHTHIYPDNIAHKAATSVREFYQLGDDAMDGTVRSLLKLGNTAGVNEFVILPVAMRPERTRHINEFILQQVSEHDCFYGFGTIHAGMENITDEVDFIMEKGLRGVKMHPDCQVFNIDDPRLFPAYEMLEGKLPVILHMGDTRYNYSHPTLRRRLLKEFPKLQVIAAHFGGYTMHETACEELSDTKCFFDVSSSLMFMDSGVAEKYIRHYGPDRFVYGSDYPMWNPVNEMERFQKLDLSDAEKEQIAWKTAAALLNIK